MQRKLRFHALSYSMQTTSMRMDRLMLSSLGCGKVLLQRSLHHPVCLAGSSISGSIRSRITTCGVTARSCLTKSNSNTTTTLSRAPKRSFCTTHEQQARPGSVSTKIDSVPLRVLIKWPKHQVPCCSFASVFPS